MNGRTLVRLCLLVATTGLVGLTAESAIAVERTAIERAEGLTLSKAVGHWSRTRSYLLLALREFDKGTEVVDPDSLIDAAEYRQRILDHIQVLDRVINPQPRVTDGGVRFEAAPELLGAEKR